MIYQELCLNCVDEIYNLLLTDDIIFVEYDEFDVNNYLYEFTKEIINLIPTSILISSGNNEFKLNINNYIVVGKINDMFKLIELRII
jgi:hypothetical protein